MSGYRKPYRCGCDKIRYRAEVDALATITRHPDRYDGGRAYKCPGHSCWHIATRGFKPSALQSQGRIVAWHAMQRGTVDYVDLARREFGMSDGDITGRVSRWSKYRTRIGQLQRVGLVAVDAPRSGYLIALDKEGLWRVCQIGLSEYLAESVPESR